MRVSPLVLTEGRRLVRLLRAYSAEEAADSVRDGDRGVMADNLSSKLAHTVRLLSVNGEQNGAKQGNERGGFSSVLLYLVVWFGMGWQGELLC